MNEKKGNEAVSVETQVNSISERKREANRLNALRSTGPKSETGKESFQVERDEAWGAGKRSARKSRAVLQR